MPAPVSPFVEGPLGFHCTEAVAKALEAILKGHSKDSAFEYQRTLLVKGAAVEKHEVSAAGERTDTSIVGSSAPDREAEVVLAGGLELKQFRDNPVVTFNHRYDLLPVGKAQWIKYDGRRDLLIAKSEYTTRPPDWEGEWLADAVWHLVKEGVLKGKSVGFLPMDIRAPTYQEIQAKGWQDVDRVITKGLLLEYAVAGIPINPDALVESISKSADALPDAVVKALGLDAILAKSKEKPAPEPPPAKTKTLDPDRFHGRAIETKAIPLSEVSQHISRRIQEQCDSIDWQSFAADRLDVARGRV